MSQMEGEWVHFPLCQMYQPPFFGFSEMLTTKKSTTGVSSKLKWSHSGVIPAKSPKESTPGDSDSRNRCKPSLWITIYQFLVFFTESRRTPERSPWPEKGPQRGVRYTSFSDIEDESLVRLVAYHRVGRRRKWTGELGRLVHRGHWWLKSSRMFSCIDRQGKIESAQATLYPRENPRREASTYPATPKPKPTFLVLTEKRGL